MYHGTPYATILGYAFEADLHCIDCTMERFPDLEDGVTEDNEGNVVTAYLSGQDTNDTDQTEVCGDCFDVIYEVDADEEVLDPE